MNLEYDVYGAFYNAIVTKSIEINSFDEPNLRYLQIPLILTYSLF